jgi:hypothetical protein
MLSREGAATAWDAGAGVCAAGSAGIVATTAPRIPARTMCRMLPLVTFCSDLICPKGSAE